MLGSVLILIAVAGALYVLECVARLRRASAGISARQTLLWSLAFMIPLAAAAAVGSRALWLALGGAVLAGTTGLATAGRALLRRHVVPGLITGAAALVPLALMAGLVARTDERATLWPDFLVALGLGLALLGLTERLAPRGGGAGGRRLEGRPARRAVRRIGVAAALIATLAITVAAIVAVAGQTTGDSLSAREIAWGEADVGDHTRFPERAIRTSAPAYRFARTAREASPTVRVREGNRVVARELEQFLASTGTLAFIVIKDGRLVYERYFENHEHDSIVTSFSIAKAFNSALIGIAIEEGYIDGVDDPVSRYVPELLRRDARFEAVTLSHLLSMSSGLRYDEAPVPWNDGAITYYDPDLREAALNDTVVVRGAGEEFLYNNYNPLLLGLVIERATGRSVSEYLEAKLWKPLGMEADGSWSLDSTASGFEKMESGINGRAIDFAKLGALYLNAGRWRGRQLVPSTWVRESTRIDTSGDPSPYYQYGWWTPTGAAGPAFMAEGNFGQYIYVAPEPDVVIVRFGREYGYGHRFKDGLPGTWPELFGQIADDL
ncbi:MAG: beta-lactamase family protein [Thermoleophilia bacterium]|nr:beta-lactamase family protein [Thermoleophilia bacterium]